MDEPIVDVWCNSSQNRYCAIKLNHVFCDGYAKKTPNRGHVGVFSHFHEDHIGAVTECIGSYDIMITHPITFKGIIALKPGIRYREQWITQDFDTVYHTSTGDQVRLLKANHIPGSAQVHVEGDGKSMLYSGDFSFPNMQIKSADYLVLDATHGDPGYDGVTDRWSVMNRMFDIIKEVTDDGKSIIIQTSGGTLQEIVRYFEIVYADKIPDTVTFAMDKKQRDVLFSIYGNDANGFRDIVEYDSREFWRLVREQKPCIVFLTSSIIKDELSRFTKIIVDQYRFDSKNPPIIQFANEHGGGYRFNLASHASIQNIYSYVEAVHPKYVLTDNSRSNFAPHLAKLIRQRFPNIKTEYKPS